MTARSVYSVHYFDENDALLFAATPRRRPAVGHNVRHKGVNYMIWYVEEIGGSFINARLELVNELRPETTIDQ